VAGDPGAVVFEVLARDVHELRAQEVHGGEHIALGQAHPDVGAPDAAAALPILRVPGALQELPQPDLHRDLKPLNLRVVHEDAPRAGAAINRVVESLGDHGQNRISEGQKRLERLAVRGAKADVVHHLSNRVHPDPSPAELALPLHNAPTPLWYHREEDSCFNPVT
jgi:hypothetical protein